MTVINSTEKVTMAVFHEKGEILARDIAKGLDKMPSGWKLSWCEWDPTRLTMHFSAPSVTIT